MAMIEKHYGKYIRNDVDEQLARILGSKSATLQGDEGKGGSRLGESLAKMRP
jgi:hypothetical protein